MLKELNQYDNLGSPKFFWELLCQLQNNKELWTTDNVRDYFFNRIIDEKSVFDGCLPLVIALDIVRVDQDKILSMNQSFAPFLVDEKYLRIKILERLLQVLKDDEVFLEIFCSENVSYDVVYHLIQIENSAFSFRYSNFRQLLISFNFLNQHPDQKIHKFIIDHKYRRLFDKFVLPEIKRRKIGIEKLEEILEQKQIHGAEAEEFVVTFEKQRLFNHSKLQDIQKISDYDVSAGYDVISYNDIDSTEYNRFIEVKSYEGNERFYWSKNEVSQARIKRDEYFLYLVDRKKMNDNYEPLIIQNPFENVFSSDLWVKEPQTWLFQRKENLS